MNHIHLIGRLTADPELRYTPSGTAVCSFTLAVDRKFSKNDETDFVPVTAWRQLAEICNEFLHKGKLVAVFGRLQTSSYEDRDGNRRKKFEVVADEMQMLDRGSGGSGSGGGSSGGQRSGAGGGGRPGGKASSGASGRAASRPGGAPRPGGGGGQSRGPASDVLDPDDVPF